MSAVLHKATERFSETAIDDEVVVMSLASGDFYSLTGTARAIWLLIDGTRDRAALLAALAEQYRPAPAELGADLDAFLGELQAAGLLVAG